MTINPTRSWNKIYVKDTCYNELTKLYLLLLVLRLRTCLYNMFSSLIAREEHLIHILFFFLLFQRNCLLTRIAASILLPAWLFITLLPDAMDKTRCITHVKLQNYMASVVMLLVQQTCSVFGNRESLPAVIHHRMDLLDANLPVFFID